MVAATEMDVLESRITRVEEMLHAIEQRLAALEREPPVGSVAPSIPIDDAPEPSMFDFALIGKSILIVGGAYVLRALTEMGLVPQRAGVALAFVYAMVWIALAGRRVERSRRTAALFAASTAAMIATALIFEATTRFHAVGAVAASARSVVVALALLAVSTRRHDGAFALIAAAMMTFTSIGLAIGTGNVLPPAIAVTMVGIVALSLQMESYVTLTLATVSDFLALALLVMSAFDRVSRSLAASALLAIALPWVIAIERRPRWPESIQTAAVLLIAGGGALLLTFDAFGVAMIASAIAVATVAIGRRSHRAQWTMQAPFWALAATVAILVSHSRTPALLLVGALLFAAFALTPRDAPPARLTLLATITAIVLASVDRLLLADDAGFLAMERSIVIALAATLLSLAGRTSPDAAKLAPIVLALGGVKFLAEDTRAGGAATIAVALAAYGTAMVILSRRKAPQLTLKENA